MVHRRAEVVVDEDAAAAVGCQPGVALGQDRSVWPWRPAEYITASAGICLPLASVVTVPLAPTSTAVTCLAEPERHREVAQVKLKRLDDLGIAEVQHRVALLDDGDLGAKGGEHRRVLDADHAGADHHH